jgi:hypothetical protein
MRSIVIVCLVLAVICAAGICTDCEKGEIPYEKAFVVQVIDGDTIELLGGEHVRYFCIDTLWTQSNHSGLRWKRCLSTNEMDIFTI